jgi:LPS export ABC transporter protein LptC
MMNRGSRLLLFLCCAATLAPVSCSDKPEKLAVEAEAEKPAEKKNASPTEFAQELQGVTYSQSKGDRLQWELVAKSIEQVMDGPTNLKDVKVTYYSDDGKVTVLTADEASYEDATRNTTLHGNVVITRSDDSTLSTDFLKWHQEEEMLRGEGSVMIERGESIIKGKGFELSPTRETFNIFHVEGIIHQGDMEL